MSDSSKLSVFFRSQVAQQRELGLDPSSLDDVARARAITDLVALLHEESSELGRLGGGYKHHLLTRVSVERSVIAEEVADVLKTTLALAATFGLDAGDVEEAFWRKTTAISAKAKTERTTLTEGTRLVCLDIDDVVCDLSPLREELGGGLIDIDAPPAERLAAAERVKEQFYEGGRFREMEEVEGASEAIRELAANDFTIVIITARPQWQYKRLYADTVTWLHERRIPFARVLFNQNKVEALHQHVYPAWPRAFVEDHERNIKALASAGVEVFVFDRPWNQSIRESRNVIRVYDWKDIVRILRFGTGSRRRDR